MQPREFFNAWIGHSDSRRDHYSVLFGLIKFHAGHVTMSEKQARSLNQKQNPFRGPVSSGKPMTMEQVLSSFPKNKKKKDG